MISMAFVNSGGRNEVDRIMYPCTEFLESVDEEISKITASYYCNKSMLMLESEIMDKPVESMMVMLESEKKGIIAKLGELVISIFDKVIGMIQGIGNWIKNLGFKNKSNLDKCDKLCAEHPDLKDEIKKAFNASELDLSDAKSLKDLDAAYEAIVKMSKDEKSDPKTWREKWKAHVEKYDTDNSAAVKGGKIAGGATAILSLGVAAYTIKQKIKEADLRCTESEKELSRLQRETYDALKKQGTIDDSTGRAEALTAISRELAGKHSAAMKKNNSVLEKLQNGLDWLLDTADKKLSKVTGDKTEAFHKDMEYGLKKDAEEKGKERR